LVFGLDQATGKVRLVADEFRVSAAMLAILSWCVAAGFLLVPGSWTSDPGPSGEFHSCGIPAFFHHGSFVSSLTRDGRGWDEDTADKAAEQCEEGVALRVRVAVDLILVSLPALAAWCLLGRSQPARREDSGTEAIESP
jgi:hypothetical protein